MDSSAKVLSEYVLRAISDDCEEFDRIRNEVTTWAAERGIVFDHEELVHALEGLLTDGYAQAYWLEASPGNVRSANYSRDRLEALWFYVTPKGKELGQELMKRWH